MTTTTHCPGLQSCWVGPGSAGGDSCHCGFTLSWPDSTSDEDRAVLESIMEKHLEECEVADEVWDSLLHHMALGIPAGFIAGNLRTFAERHPDRAEAALVGDDWDGDY